MALLTLPQFMRVESVSMSIRRVAPVSILRPGIQVRWRSELSPVSTTASAVCARTVCFPPSLFTAKERDAESGSLSRLCLGDRQTGPPFLRIRIKKKITHPAVPAPRQSHLPRFANISSYSHSNKNLSNPDWRMMLCRVPRRSGSCSGTGTVIVVPSIRNCIMR